MSEVAEYGPKMRVLTEKQRRFVFAMVTSPGLPQWRYAEMAGYEGGTSVTKVKACNLLQDERISQAIHECAGMRLRSGALVAAECLMELAASKEAPTAIRLRASEALLDRVGLSGQQNINVKHEHTDLTGKAMMERIKELAAKHGLDAAALLGAEKPMRVIEHVGGQGHVVEGADHSSGAEPAAGAVAGPADVGGDVPADG